MKGLKRKGVGKIHTEKVSILIVTRKCKKKKRETKGACPDPTGGGKGRRRFSPLSRERVGERPDGARKQKLWESEWGGGKFEGRGVSGTRQKWAGETNCVHLKKGGQKRPHPKRGGNKRGVPVKRVIWKTWTAKAGCFSGRGGTEGGGETK